jgi:hypothetical protein
MKSGLNGSRVGALGKAERSAMSQRAGRFERLRGPPEMMQVRAAHLRPLPAGLSVPSFATPVVAGGSVVVAGRREWVRARESRRPWLPMKRGWKLATSPQPTASERENTAAARIGDCSAQIGASKILRPGSR